jgi:hypothetical protein
LVLDEWVMHEVLEAEKWISMVEVNVLLGRNIENDAFLNPTKS